MPDSTCIIDGCERLTLARGWCSAHYQRNKIHGTPEPAHLPPVKQAQKLRCSVDGCDRLAGHNKNRMCGMHNGRLRRHGDPLYQRPKTIGVETCSIDGCGGVVKAMGWCQPHWKRYNKYGTPERATIGCVICTVQFVPYGHSTTCSKKCAKELVRRYGQRYMQEKRKIAPTRPPVVRTEAVCYCCNATFMADKRRWRYCSRRCFRAYKNKANWPHLVKRRMRMQNALVEVFDRREIFERDDWVCQLCMAPVYLSLPWPHPMSPSLDHIVPISRGGKHSRANAQTSHALCNMQKGAKLAV